MHQHPELQSLHHVHRDMVARDVKVPCQLQQQPLQEQGREPMGTGHIRHFGDQLVQRTDGTLGAALLSGGEMDEAKEKKVAQMKEIKRLGNEKSSLQKKQQHVKTKHAKLKLLLARTHNANKQQIEDSNAFRKAQTQAAEGESIISQNNTQNSK